MKNVTQSTPDLKRFGMPGKTNLSKIHTDRFQRVPGRSFGTGDHPTTALCIEMIGEYLRPGDNFLDVGTGSGILMTTAAKLGAEKAVGFDRHFSAAANARKNLVLNGIEEHRFFVFVADRIGALKGLFNVAVINILPETIIRLLPDLHPIMASEGKVICSGMIEGNIHRVKIGLSKSGFELTACRQSGKWIGLVGKRC